MSDQNKSSYNQSGLPQGVGHGGYTPAPVSRTRSLTGVQNAIDVQSDPRTQDADQSAYPQSQVLTPPPETTSSIQINLDTIDRTTQSVMEQEQKAAQKLAQFDPLSATPVFSAPATSEARIDWSSTPIPDVLTPPAYESSSSPAPDLYRSRKRFMYLLFLFVLMFIWFIGMSIQIGTERLFADPMGETLKLLNGGASQSELAPVEDFPTKVIVEKGLPRVNFTEVNPVSSSVFEVKGTLQNQTSKPIEAARIKVTLRSPEESDQPWAHSVEFNCCREINFSSKSKDEQAELLELVQSGRADDEEIELSLDQGSRTSFSYLVGLKSNMKLKRGQSPRVSVELIYYE